MAQFSRGTNNGSEYERSDHSFYKGIVVKNWDPQKLLRVKIYVPEISNQPLEDWLQEYKNINVRFPGKNNRQDAWRDTDIYEEISKFLPWAEPCTTLLGENSPARYWSQLGTALTTDSNYAEAFAKNNVDPPDEDEGGWGPSFLYEQQSTNTSDYFWWPTEENNYAVNNNPYSFHFRPSNQVDKGKGVFSVPSIGSQVWLFHYRGDYNFPVYIGGRTDRRVSSLIYNEDAPGPENGPPDGGINHSMDYPGVFENFPTTDDEIKRDTT
tara:strand:+ start:272 stop:1072 length:801 start_codon:yes stop_codon:yes gene_type:complete